MQYAVGISNDLLRTSFPSYRHFSQEIPSTFIANVTYSLQEPSAEYALFSILKYGKTAHPMWQNRLRSIPLPNPQDESGFAYLASLMFGRFLTIQISSDYHQDFNWYKKSAQAFLFNISLNYNLVWLPFTFERDLRIPRRTTNSHEGQLTPYHSYRSDLINYYYHGLESNSSLLRYIAFYQVAETFFYDISKQEVNQVVRDIITHPSFLATRDEDVDKVINELRKKLRQQSQNGVWNESEALLLTLKKYVTNLDDLQDTIKREDPLAIDYYKSNLVSFADKTRKIDFSEPDKNKLYTDIRDRTYAVRNAIIHSKEGEKKRFIPYNDNNNLEKEVPLIKAIAQLIIISNGKIIKYKTENKSDN